MKLNNFNKDKSSLALILTSILSVFLFTFNDSNLLIFLDSLWCDSKKIILKPKTDLDAFLVYKDTFKKQVIENIQIKLSSNKNHFPRCESVDIALDNFDDFENKKIKNKQINLKSNEWVFANVFTYPKTQLSNSALVDVGIDDFENIMVSTNYTDEITGYPSKMDVESFVDFILVQELAKNVDAYRLSTYIYKDKESVDDRLTAGPVWDFNHGFGNCDYGQTWEPENWLLEYNPEGGDQMSFWW